MVFLPHVVTPITVTTPRASAAVEAAHSSGKTLVIIGQRENAKDPVTLEDLHPIGTEAALGRLLRLPDKNKSVLVQGRRRVEIAQIVQNSPYVVVKARPIPEKSTRPLQEQISMMETVMNLFERLGDLNTNIPEGVLAHIINITDPGKLADALSAVLTISVDDRQRLLETLDPTLRLQQIAALLNQELAMLELKDEISNQVQQEMDRGQREVYLREQMRIIQTELGEEDIFQQEINEVRQQIIEAHLPPEIHERALKELGRLGMMPPMAPEIGIIRTYIDWITSLPWHNQHPDNLDMRHAQQVLEEDHYGLAKVKDRILEHIAVRKLAAEKMKNPILCFVGPPGVGKTSLGKSIARALGREFVRVSLGGVRDEAEIRGHRRTYIGAMPGRILQTMRRLKTINPVFMLDEIDKVGADFRGDPSAALLEVLDPEQNNAFSDHYLEVPYDLSKVMFITTANDLDPLPPALLDRLEMIEFVGYTDEEKLAIARQFLIPKQLEAHGLKVGDLQFETRALQTMIREYTYEAGVRNLERTIANVCRKIARQMAETKPHHKRLTSKRVEELLGPPDFIPLRANTIDAIGVATGMSWTSNGGDTLTIEAAVLPGKGSLLMTGQLGDVMQESAQAALSYMRAHASDFGIPNDDFENYDIHVHVPEGAVPKEGPSAGVPLAIAIISAFTERKIRSDYAMSGEITLHGKILPVGGIKEKVLAARRARIKNVILCKHNKKDLTDVPAEALKDLHIIFVEDMAQVIDLVLLAAPPERKRDLEKSSDEKSEAESTP
ncbi:MAG: endopeptidase La [Chloroflexi bacterium]|nr:endopeptidase La [Chloroflexota bacterium]